jgi:NADPH-dependent curcumin reductase CurA
VELARPWIAEGRLRLHEDVGEGIASAPAQFERLMRGENLGKTLVRTGEG